MKRLVLIGVVALAALVCLMVVLLRTPAETQGPKLAALAAREQPPLPKFSAGRNADPESATDVEEPVPGAPPKKLDPQSVEFFQRFDEMIARRLTAEAATCYHGGKERDQKVKFGFRAVIRGGQVSIRDVKLMVSTLNDPSLERCMQDKVAKFSSWKDDSFPDYEMDDEVLIRIRALKKHKQEEDTSPLPPETESIPGY